MTYYLNYLGHAQGELFSLLNIIFGLPKKDFNHWYHSLLEFWRTIWNLVIIEIVFQKTGKFSNLVKYDPGYSLSTNCAGLVMPLEGKVLLLCTWYNYILTEI